MNVRLPSLEPDNTVDFTPMFAHAFYALKKGYRFHVFEGSSRSGKTYAILQCLLLACLSPKDFVYDCNKEGILVRCYRKEASVARNALWEDTCKILGDWGIEAGQDGFSKNETMMTWSFPNGSKLVCSGAEDWAKLRSVRQDLVFFNEVMDISQKSFTEANIRTTYSVIMDFNPSLNEHWLFKRNWERTGDYVMGKNKDGTDKVVKVYYAHSTYKDNQFLPQEQINSIEQLEPTPQNVANGTADEHLWSVLGLGKRGFREGRIIPADKVDIIEDDEFPSSKQWESHGYGLDWGWSDPMALVECAIFNKKFYVRELIYEKELNLVPDPSLPNKRSLVDLLKRFGIGASDTIVCDSARPDLIDALRSRKYSVLPADKRPGSIDHGINLMNQRRWCVTEGSSNIRFELENWTWKESRSGEQVSKPIGKFDHALDASRYWLSAFLHADSSVAIGAEDVEETYLGCDVDVW